ncbi:unnamed protein product [Caenorhabditis nigoni]
MFIISAKSRYHPYGKSHRAHFQDKVWRRSVFASPADMSLETIEGRAPTTGMDEEFDYGDIKLNNGQQRCFDVLRSKVESKKQFFEYIGGQAGTGKSAVLRQFAEFVRQFYRMKEACVVSAPVGKAAQLVGGETIHSLLKFSPGQKAFQALPEFQMLALANKLKNLQVLIIDELSLVTGLLLAQIDHRLRELFGDDQPFGGVSIVVFGDLLQLPAVSTLKEVVKVGGVERTQAVPQNIFDSVPKIYEALYASITPRRPEFRNLWRRFEMDELTENVRTSCPLEQCVLEEVRVGKQSERTMEFLISRCEMVGKKPEDLHRELRRLRNEDPEGEYVIQAFKNSRVDELNDWIAANSPKSVQIETLTECPSCTRLPRNGHKKKSLTLVIGGRVVITDNHGLEDPSLANGVSGVLLAVGRNFLSIRRTDNGKEVRITRFKYTNSNRKAEGVWFQYPVAMAEAMSVHKGQGSTCDGSVIDFIICK